jgi:hypothetical protein
MAGGLRGRTGWAIALPFTQASDQPLLFAQSSAADSPWTGRGKGWVALDHERPASWRPDRPCRDSPLAILSSVNAIVFVMNGWLTASNPVER